MTSLEQTEYSILKFISTTDPRDGKSTHWGGYSTSVGTVNGTILLDLTKDLHATGHIELKKWTDRGLFPLQPTLPNTRYS